MIENLEVTNDSAGFPIVRWSETRARGDGRVAIECRIVKAPTTGELLFAARSQVREGAYEEARPWKDLRGFAIRPAHQLYQSAMERTILQHFGGKALLSKLLSDTQEQVILAEFPRDVRLHVNAVDAPVIDLERLHLALTDRFVTLQRQLVGDLCEVAYQWPHNDNRVETYKPDRAAPKGQRKRLLSILDVAFAITLVAGFAAIVIWVAVLLFR